MQNLSALLAEKGFLFSPTFDGQYQRNGSKWYRGVQVTVGAKTIYLAKFGDWRDDSRFSWQSDEPATDEEMVLITEAIALFHKAETEEKKRVQDEVAKQASTKWLESIDRGTTPYLQKKGLPGLFGAKIDPERTDRLLVPARDVHGRLWGYQRVLAEKIQVGDDWVDKFFLKGMRIDGCFHLIGELPREDADSPILVAEGFATAASLHLATGLPVAAAFNAGNLESVCRALRSRHAHAKLVVCGDDDRWTKRKDGTPWNPGREKASQAARAVDGILALPRFSDLSSRPTDFNDLHALGGLPLVKEQVERALQGEAPPEEGERSSEPGSPSEGDSGPGEPNANGPGAGVPDSGTKSPPAKKKKFSEKKVADTLIQRLDGRVIRQDKVLFAYDGLKWVELDEPAIDHWLKNPINALCGDQLSSKDVTSIYRTLLRYLPTVPQGVNLHQPRPDRANFLNGTLHVGFEPKSPEELAQNPGSGAFRFRMEFKPHAMTDFCTTVLPLEYQPVTTLRENTEFEGMLRRIWPDSDPDQEAKVWLYKEVLGSALVPLFPKIFFFVGAPRSGKSTLLALVRKLLGSDNTSSVDPSLWSKSFHMEPMLNKLGNIHEDISTTRLIDDSLMKSIIDGLPMSINRKNKAMASARLPALHTYGCNDMPKSLEGGSGAYERRALIVRTSTPQAGQGGGGEFSTWIWQQGPEGVLRAALEGLERLLRNGGQYTRPESSRAEVEKWGLESDPVAQFIDAIQHGEIRPGENTIFVVSESASISKRILHEEYVAFSLKARPGDRPMSEITFCKRLRQENRFKEHRDTTGRYWLGIGFVGRETGSKDF